MQLKSIALSASILVFSTTLQAQQTTMILKIVKKVDTSTAPSSPYLSPKNALLASNVPASFSEKQPYSKVPLAGEKAYFGEKNEYVNDFVRKYLEHNNRTLSSVQNNSEAPFSVIDDILEEKKMPKELKYLAVIESALNHNAVSHAGAVGPWQLMETTAKMMGLSVNRKVDERTDWTKSTKAATKYLDLLYSELNDWLLVVAAYNSGPTPVHRAIEKTGSHNFWEIKEYLPKETQGHVLAFIATATIFENFSKFISLGSVPADFKFSKEKDKDEEPTLKDVVGKKTPAVAAPGSINKASFTEEELKNMAILKIEQVIHFEVLEHEIGIDKKLMARWNPDYELFATGKYPTPYYKIKMPKDKVDAFLLKKQSLVQLSKNLYK